MQEEKDAKYDIEDTEKLCTKRKGSKISRIVRLLRISSKKTNSFRKKTKKITGIFRLTKILKMILENRIELANLR